jgi:ATP-dependent DNA helicase RecG
MIPWKMDGLDVLQLKVNVGSYTPYYYVGDGQRVAFVRKGSQSVPATAEEMVRLVLKGSNRTFDSLRTDKRKEDHSFVMLANTFKERTGQDWDKKYLLSFGLVTDDGYLTNAGALFADNCWLSQSRLYCTRWDGQEKGDALNDAEFKGNVLLLLREAMAFAKASTRKGWEKLPNGRKNKPEYAERAVLEACVNHFIHRDYTVMGGEVHLDIYDDRIVVTSPGGMYSGQQVQDVPLEDISSLRRNPVLADVMAQLDYMEKRGSGLRRICNETKALEAYKDDRRPVFKSSPSQFMTIIYSVDYKDAGKDAGKDTGNVTKQSLSWDQVGTKLGLSRDQVEKLLLSAIQATSAAEIRQVMNMTNATKFKRNYIDPLFELRILAMTQPDSPKSPTRKYYLTELGKQIIKK